MFLTDAINILTSNEIQGSIAKEIAGLIYGDGLR